MGLTIHYSFTARATLKDETVHRLVQRTAKLAQEIGCAHVGQVLMSHEVDRTAPEFFDSAPIREPRVRRMFGGSGGWLVEVWPGEGCEPAVFGLVRHRPRIPGEPWRTRHPRRNSRWEFNAFCKTCYAATHGMEHFIQCHERVIRLLDLWCRADVRVKVHDGSGFWQVRSRETLAAQIGNLKLVRQVICT